MPWRFPKMGDPPNPSKSIQSRICQYKPSSGPASMGYPIDGNPHGKIQNELPNRRRISRFCLPCGRPRTLTIPWPGHALRQKVMLVDGPAKSKSPVEKGGFCIPLFICFQHVSTFFWWWPIHSMMLFLEIKTRGRSLNWSWSCVQLTRSPFCPWYQKQFVLNYKRHDITCYRRNALHQYPIST